MAELTQKKRVVLALLLVLSTVFLPIQVLGFALYLIPSIYVSIIVPYLICRLLFRTKTVPLSLWIIPKVLILICFIPALIYFEFMVFGVYTLIIPLNIDLSIWKTVEFLICITPFILLLRAFTYMLMIFVWDNRIIRSKWLKALLWIGTVLYLLCAGICLLVGMAVSEMYSF